ncbi:PEF-CTERM sorting domain-containing protein [Methanomethylovorans sp.]|uniref:PEF-CTERM sorting domain-containing protein n=1 Tax=Methanomethylovorans sp. TaxID=2758717 RepID=UPI00345F11EB
MRKALQIIGIIAVLFAMVGGVSAGTMYLLDQNNENKYDDLIVLVDAQSGKVTFLLKYPMKGNIDKVFLTVPSSDSNNIYGYPTYTVNNNTGYKFDLMTGSFQPDGFDKFATGFHATGEQKNIVMVIVPVDLPSEKLPYGDNGHIAAAHVKELDPPLETGEKSDLIAGNSCNGGEIPEFPTVALPIAAILGLAFVFMRRK